MPGNVWEWCSDWFDFYHPTASNSSTRRMIIMIKNINLIRQSFNHKASHEQYRCSSYEFWSCSRSARREHEDGGQTGQRVFWPIIFALKWVFDYSLAEIESGGRIFLGHRVSFVDPSMLLELSDLKLTSIPWRKLSRDVDEVSIDHNEMECLEWRKSACPNLIRLNCRCVRTILSRRRMEGFIYLLVTILSIMLITK